MACFVVCKCNKLEMMPARTIYKSLMCIALLLSAHGRSDSQTLHWAKQLGSKDADEGTAIAVSSGSVYCGGNFQDTMDTDPGPAVANLISKGHTDVFISKLDTAGNFIWTKQIEGTGSEYCKGIAADKNGNVYITGTFLGMTDFDPGPGIFNLTSSASSDAYVCKLDALGNFIWAKQFGPGQSFFPQPVIADAIALDDSGNVYTTGSFDGPSDFDPGPTVFTLSPVQVMGMYTTDIFVSKLDASGNFVWAKQLGGAGFEGAHAIAVDGNANVYTTGFFNGTVDFDPGPGTFNLSAPPASAGVIDIFISKLDAGGNFAWAKQMGSGRGYAIAVDKAGNVYASGDFSNDSTTIYKVDPSGNTVWAKEFGASMCWSLATDAQDNIFLTGPFYGTKDLDPGPAVFNVSAINSDSYISKVDSAGNLSWAKQLGGTYNVSSRSLAVDVNDNIYTTGIFEGTADFDPAATTYNLTTIGSMDVFIHKMRPMNLGVEEASMNHMFNLYPNPTGGKFSIDFQQGHNYSDVVLTNLAGQILHSTSVINQTHIDMETGEASGIYLLELYDMTGNISVARILKN